MKCYRDVDHAGKWMKQAVHIAFLENESSEKSETIDAMKEEMADKDERLVVMWKVVRETGITEKVEAILNGEYA